MTTRISIKQWFFMLIACVAILTVGCGQPDSTSQPETSAQVEEVLPVESSSGSIMIFAAASTQEWLEGEAERYFDATGIEVDMSFAGSGTLARQLLAGAQADLFLSANASWAERIAEEFPVVKHHNLLSNRLVVITHSESLLAEKPTTDVLQLLTDPQVERIAIADPVAAPVGKYARKALESMGVWDGLNERLIFGSDVRATLAYAERGEVDLAFVYATDAAILGDAVVMLAEIDEALTGQIVYPMLWLGEGEPDPTVAALWEMLLSPEALERARGYGFTPLP